MTSHPVGECPGLGQCEHSWHDNGCDPFWQYCSPNGRDITHEFYAEQDAIEKRLWEGPDGPSEVWIRASTSDGWERES